MKFVNCVALSLLCSYVNPLLACVRDDVIDRSAEECRAQAIRLGANLPASKVTGAVIVVGNDGMAEVGTGVALDRYTVLTAAHIKGLGRSDKVYFKLAANAQGDYGKNEFLIGIKDVIIHPSFEVLDEYTIELFLSDRKLKIGKLPKKAPISERDACDGVAIEYLDGLSYQDFKLSNLAIPTEFRGVDLAILKLSEPLPASLAYPKILDGKPVNGEYGISIGFGDLLINNQECGPTKYTDEILEKNKRHVVSCKVSLSPLENDKVFYGNYRGLLVNGNESFIPDGSMLKTEGLPVGGDSGGPLFVKDRAGNYALAGILCRIYSAYDEHVLDEKSREALSGIIQPIFPIWTDLRQYMEWLRGHMGK